MPAAELPRLAAPGVAAELAARFKAIGFRYVTLDLEGFRSGSLNALVEQAESAENATSPVDLVPLQGFSG